ncbi:RagB/SusD family nutrient uptake outer membrane protein [Flavilitoribacter nigricans]|uniref:RagB/SusD family nutrient uptake outer membrane protein n=1 Tax=Flavilitoribacter nigricans (strain ATCC 23147 / DSM 23189 / NBRC 102662 / NCIMB 1420 / SS-2) TaxID=1122177 RepID=A0A2D0MYA9_FLAN2|nr:RagB/SusD family nutrient uptake outer membrane protein [Flavilitoribacter nigricans]PHN01170.1 RagB/SusD family nutrient uptake outer membrane protein [Flavilitoribacter nigricans DSM 23189 = NBRC 102662]
MNYSKYITLLAFLLFSSACSKEFLEIVPQDRTTPENFYNSESNIRASTAAMYSLPWFDFNANLFWLAGDLMAGNLYYTYDQQGQFMFNTFNSGNAHLLNGYKSLYRVVAYANSIITDVPDIAPGFGVSEEVINAALGEARFMRAAAYFFIAEYWGEAPIIENSKDLIASNEVLLPKNFRTDLYEFMRRDLEFAAANLPETDEPGRVTSWAAKGLLAKLHLTMASDLDDADSAANFTKAKELAADVIENSGLSLMPNYADLFKIPNNNSGESLFALQWIEGSYGTGNNRQAQWARSSRITGITEAWGGGISATYDLIQAVEEGDKRRSAIYMTAGDFYPEMNTDEGGYLYEIAYRDPGNPDVILEFAAPVLNNTKKYIVGSFEDTNGGVTTNQATRLNSYVLRLADVYLIYAEATLGAAESTSDAQALDYVNTIRDRAGLEPLSSLTFLDILRERRVEFALEQQYWFDIKRYYYRAPQEALAMLNAQQRAYTYQMDWNNIPNPDPTNIDHYILVPPETPVTFSESQIFLPLPAAEVVSNPLLAQEAERYDFQ